MTRTSLAVVLLSALAVSAAAEAQETQTQRDAARDVIRKMGDLERSLDVPALVTALTAPNPSREQVVARTQALMAQEFLSLSDDICTHPEVGYKEVRSVEKLTTALKAGRVPASRWP